MNRRTTGTSTSIMDCFRSAGPTDVDIEILNEKPLAFSTANKENEYVRATSRSPLRTADRSALLNVECFFFDEDEGDEKEKSVEELMEPVRPTPVFLFVHGVCASAETVGVQHLARHAEENRPSRVAVLELEGHGLSSGTRCVCGDFERLVSHVVEFVRHVMKRLTEMDRYAGCELETSFVLCGCSLGGLLVAYAADEISRSPTKTPGQFLGVTMISPDVGVDAQRLPSSWSVLALRLMAYLAPSAQVTITTLEDPTMYSAPRDSSRNFKGYWPLATARMIFDVASHQADRKSVV